jgi:hypothetical protein
MRFATLSMIQEKKQKKIRLQFVSEKSLEHPINQSLKIPAGIIESDCPNTSADASSHHIDPRLGNSNISYGHTNNRSRLSI